MRRMECGDLIFSELVNLTSDVLFGFLINGIVFQLGCTDEATTGEMQVLLKKKCLAELSLSAEVHNTVLR